MKKNKFYITTSIPYLNGAPHLGFALEAVQADVIARYHRFLEKDVFFLSGADEHGATIVRAAEKAGKNPKEFVDAQVLKFLELLNKLGISNDDFIRTSDQKRHWPGAQEFWKKLENAGDIYKGFYKGLYCVGHEAFITEKDLENGVCKLHKKEPESIEEENYFFRLSKYTKKVKELIEKDEIKILPEFRKNEVLNMLDNAEDISFSRPAKDLSWGIPVPGDATQTMYVWCDALSNYITANPTRWPADVHLIGKDIIKFHAVFWPAMLLSAGLPLPKIIFVHGFINLKGEKMSKTVGNVVDPFPLIEKYGKDAVRFFLCHEISTFGDSDYSQEHFYEVYNGLLVNGLGNVVSRVTKMIENVGGAGNNKFESNMAEKYHECMEKYEIGEAIKLVWGVLHELDEYIEKEKVYKLIKENPMKAKAILGSLLDALKTVAELISSFLPETSQKMREALENPSKRIHLFPRIEK